MEEIAKAIELATKAIKEKYLVDEPLQDGDEFIAVLNNCCIRMTFKDGNFRSEFIPDVVHVDMILLIYDGM